MLPLEPRRRALRTLAGAATVLVAAGCQVLLSADRVQCNVDADCVTAAGAGFVCRNEVCVAQAAPPPPDASADVIDTTSPWGCLASPPPRDVVDRSQKVVLRQRLLVYSLSDCEHNRPVAGAEVKLCSADDVTCGSPVEMTVADCDGAFSFQAAYRGFRGFALVSPPRRAVVDGGQGPWPSATTSCFAELAAREKSEGRSGERCAIRSDEAGNPIVPLPDDLVPGLIVVVHPPPVGDDSIVAPHLLSSGTLKSMLGVVGKPFSAKAAHLVGQTLDCQRRATAGVSIRLTGGIGIDSQLYYTDSQALPNVNQGATADRGETGYLNLDPGATGFATLSVTSTLEATGQRVGTYAPTLRSGYVTYLWMPPVGD